MHTWYLLVFQKEEIISSKWVFFISGEIPPFLLPLFELYNLAIVLENVNKLLRTD